MVNKKGVWFLTLFSLIIVLSVYYITMPAELLINNKDELLEPTVKTEDSSILLALRVEADEGVEKELEALKKIISDSNSSIEDKNAAFDKMKELNTNRSKEDVLEEKIKSTYKLDSFIKIDNSNISVTVKSDKHDNILANNIMRSIQEEYKDKMKITVKFQA